MTDSTRGRELLMRIMGAAEEDANLPLTVLANVYRARLRAPLEKLAETYGGHVQDPWARASKVVHMVEERWPALTDGMLFEQVERLNQLLNLLPVSNVNQSYGELLQLARNPSPTVEQLLVVAWDGSAPHDPLVLLHELTHQGMSEEALECHLACLTRELEIDPAAMELINAMTDDA
jgi:hypothetical protein